MSDIFNVLADPTRRALLLALGRSSHSVSELVEITGEGQPSVSKHLKTLREAGLVVVSAEGQSRIYSIDAAPLQAPQEFLNNFGAAGHSDTEERAAAAGSESVGETAAEAISKLVSAGMGWVGSKVQAGVASIDAGTPEFGRELGRKLADARAAAGNLTSEAQEQLGADLADLGDLIAERAVSIKASAETLAADLLAQAKRRKSGSVQEPEVQAEAPVAKSTANVVTLHEDEAADF